MPGAIFPFANVKLFIVELNEIVCIFSSFSFTLNFQLAISAVPFPVTFDIYFAYACPPKKDTNMATIATTTNIIFLLFFNKFPPCYIFSFLDF